MKKITYILILIVLLIAAGYFFFREQEGKSTLKEEYSDFAVKDTSNINRIFISDQEGVSADLQRQEDGSWTINGKYRARQSSINMLLHTIKHVAIREPVPAPAMENVIKVMSSQSKKIEIYKDDDVPEKVYYIGHHSQSSYGTYMLLEIDGKKSSKPFVTHIQGFYGYLSTRFFTDMQLWRNPTIFAYDTDEIQSVEVKYLEQPEKSYRIKRSENGDFFAEDYKTGERVEPVFKQAVDEYLARYGSINFEFIDQDTPEDAVDSVLSTEPLHTIRVTDVNGKVNELKTYYKPAKGSAINEATGEPYDYNLDRLYGWVNETDFITIQWQMLDNILAWKDDFRQPSNVDN